MGKLVGCSMRNKPDTAGIRTMWLLLEINVILSIKYEGGPEAKYAI